MKNLAERVRRARELANLNQSELARRIGAKPQAIQAIESGRVHRSRLSPDIARVTGVNLDWLLGEGGTMSPIPSQGAGRVTATATASAKEQHLIPVVAWSEIARVLDEEETWEAVRWVQCPVPFKPEIVALEVLGDAMDDGTRDAYQDGDLVWVDLGRRPEHGQDIIVLLEGDVGMIRRLSITPEGRFLTAVNPRHPDRTIRLPASARIVGVIVFSGRARA